MIHDELLAKVTHGYRWTCDRDREPWDALRAVVELHKPQEITLPDGEWSTGCIECDNWNYPCETIEVIEKELS